MSCVRWVGYGRPLRSPRVRGLLSLFIIAALKELGEKIDSLGEKLDAEAIEAQDS